jgi:ribosomal protein S18 acetylase RimI-like enzyme
MTAIVSALAEAQIAAASHVLARAFHDDPLQVYVFPDPQERTQRSPGQFAVMLRDAFVFGETLATDDLVGVSAWMAPEGTKTPPAGAQSAMPTLGGIMGQDALMRFGTTLDYVTGVHGKAAPPRHWYLMMVGVDPLQQNNGRGTALLAPVIARADAERLPICLDTPQPRVRSFYQRLGFRVLLETVDPRSGLRWWTFQRDPM